LKPWACRPKGLESDLRFDSCVEAAKAKPGRGKEKRLVAVLEMTLGEVGEERRPGLQDLTQKRSVPRNTEHFFYYLSFGTVYYYLLYIFPLS